MNSIKNYGMQNYSSVNCKNVNFKARLRDSVSKNLYSQLLNEKFDLKTSDLFMRRINRNLRYMAPGIEISGINRTNNTNRFTVNLSKGSLSQGVTIQASTPLDALETLMRKKTDTQTSLLGEFANRLFGI